MTWRLSDADWNHWPNGLDDAALWEACRASGVDGVELGVYRVGEQLTAQRLERVTGLATASGIPVRGLLLSLPVDRWPHGALTGAAAEVAAEVEGVARAAALFGLDTIGVWPGADPLDADPFAVVEGTRLAVQAAAAYGVRIAIEYKPDTAVPDAAAALALCAAVPGVGVLVDTGHAYALEEDPAEVIRRVAGRGLLWHLHLGDAQPGGADDDLPVGRHHAAAPVVAALADVGYAGDAALDLYGAVVDGAMTGRQAVLESIRALRPPGASGPAMEARP